MHLQKSDSHSAVLAIPDIIRDLGANVPFSKPSQRLPTGYMMSDSFWTGGPEAHAEGLREHYEPLLAELRRRLKSADGPQRDVVKAELSHVESEYESKRRGVGDGLY